MADVFISYAKEDRERASDLAVALTGCGWSVWWDRIIRTGQTFDEVIEEEIDAAKAVVVLWSGHSVDSRWVKREARRAERQKKLFPVLIEAVEPPWVFEDLQACDLVDWDGDAYAPAFETLVDDLRLVLGADNFSIKQQLEPGLFKSFQSIERRTVDDPEATNIALEALNRAVVATRQYEARMTAREAEMPGTAERQLEEEARIGGLWQEAAIRMRRVEADFAPVLRDKALYWFEGFHWDAEEVRARGIDWDSIQSWIDKLIAGDPAT